MLPTVKKILYATDLEPHGPKMFRYAVSLAHRYEAKIVLLHVLEPLGPTAQTLVRNVLPTEKAEELQREGLKKIRQEISDRLDRFCKEELGGDPKGRHLVAEVRIVDGHPAAAILKEAKAVKADMIVMGTHGRTGISELLLGSVAHKVVQQSALPVLLVPLRALG